MPLIPIQNIADPRVAEYAGVREAELRRDRFDAPGGLFIAEGELVVRRLAASRYRVRSVLTTRTRLNTIRDLVEKLQGEVPVYLVDQEVMNGIAGFNIHRGVLAIGERGPEPALDPLLKESSTLVVLEDLVNHDNLGGIFRNTAALAPPPAAVLLSPRCADPLYRKSIRVSMGAVLSVPFAALHPWPAGLERLRQAGFMLVAMTPDGSADDISEVEPDLRRGRVALLLGGEGPGLTAESQTHADRRARIGMPGRAPGVDSLNVSVAAAIALHRLTAARSDLQ